MDNEFIGAIKIKDGLFIGDELAAQDLEFIITNKVTHIINCAGTQLANYWESLGVIYLTYNWLDSQNQVVFDQKGEIVNEIYNFIEEAHGNGDGVLVHSEKGQSRSCCVIAAYFMKRFKWNLYKTLEFLASRRPDLEIRDSFYYQLVNLETKLIQEANGEISTNWQDVTPAMDHEELLLRNTFLNAKNAPLDEYLINPQDDNQGKIQTIYWGDENVNASAKLVTLLDDDHIIKLRLAPPKTFVKSILKGSNKIFNLRKTEKEETPQGAKKSVSLSGLSGLRLNKSLKTLHEERSGSSSTISITLKKGITPVSAGTTATNTTPTGATTTITKFTNLKEKLKNLKFSQPQNLPRSSSATYFEKEGGEAIDTPSTFAPISSNISGARGQGFGSVSINSAGNIDNKIPAAKEPSSVKGVGINLTANNPMRSFVSASNSRQSSTSLSKDSVASTKPIQAENPGNLLKTENKPTDNGAGDLRTNSNESFLRTLTQSDGEKSPMSYLPSKQLNTNDKKNTKEPEKAIDTSLAPVTNEDISTAAATENYIATCANSFASLNPRPLSSEGKRSEKPPRDNREKVEFKMPKPKEYARPTEGKVNYQLLLKNRETPPPRQREEAKKNPESVYKKALAKSSLTNIKFKENSNVSTQNSYFQNLFPASATHVNNTYTSFGTNKQMPASTKAASCLSNQLTFTNLNIPRPAQPERSYNIPSNSQNIEKGYASPTSYLDSYLKTSAGTPNGSQATQSLAFKVQMNNFTSQVKNVPVKAMYEQSDRPRSTGTANRPPTPSSAMAHLNKGGITYTTRFDRKDTTSNNNMLKPPQSGNKLNGTQPIRKESPTMQSGGKYRQRSSSPAAAQNINYDNLFNAGPGAKPKWKF